MLSIIQAAGWPIWFLIVCSILSLAIILERFVSLQTNKIAPPKLLAEVLEVCRKGLPAADVVQQLSKNSYLGEVLASGIAAAHTTPRTQLGDIDEAMEASGRRVTQKLERYIPALGTIASAAPLMGLFGTVVGMIEIFGAQAPGSGTNPAQLAHGISVALYNTAFGLVIAIPSLIFWRYFRSRVDGYVLAMELAAQELSRLLKKLRA